MVGPLAKGPQEARLGRRGALVLRTLSQAALQGAVEVAGRRLRCAIGRAGCRARKREGDGATPIGVWHLQRVLYRRDRVLRPITGLPVQPLKVDDGWGDAVMDRRYNRRVRHPYAASAERLWRQDGLYDLIVVLDHNQCPRVQGLGSAIFMHVARPGYRPTAGCVALTLADLRQVLRLARPGSRLVVPA